MSREADHTLDDVADKNFGQWLGWRLMDIGDLGAAVRSMFLRRCEGDKELRAAAINALTMQSEVGRPKLVIARVVKVQ